MRASSQAGLQALVQHVGRRTRGVVTLHRIMPAAPTLDQLVAVADAIAGVEAAPELAYRLELVDEPLPRRARG